MNSTPRSYASEHRTVRPSRALNMAGFVDLAVKPRTPSEERVVRLVRERGLSLAPLRPGSRALLLHGPGVHVIAADLHHIKPADLAPPEES